MFSLQAKKFALVVVAAVLTVLLFFTVNSVFPPVPEMAMHMPAQLLPYFIFLDFWDALAFGIGVALLIYGAMNYSKWPQPIRMPLMIMFFLSLWFTLLNWIHDGLHKSTEGNFYALVGIEFGFHVPWLIFSLALTFAILRLAGAYQAK